MKQLPTILATSALLTMAAIPASAQSAPPVNKTWVSSTGTDTGSCQLVAPCKTFAYAISETNAGGEIDVKDSGAYGPLSIDRSISIVASGGVASVGIGANQHAIDITTDNIVVDLLGLTVNTHGRVGLAVNVNCTSCRITLDKMNVQGNSTGVYVNNVGSTVFIANSHLTNNSYGLQISQGTVYLYGNLITLNDYGITGGIFHTYHNNAVDGNVTADLYNTHYISIAAE